MFSIAFPFIILFLVLGSTLVVDRAFTKQKSYTLQEKVLNTLYGMKVPMVYWDPDLILDLKTKLKVKNSLEISECLYILERRGDIQRTYYDNRRSLLLQKYIDISKDNALVTFIIVGKSLYMRSDDLNSWSKHDDWIVRVSSN